MKSSNDKQALKYAKELYGINNVAVKRIGIPRNLVRRIERKSQLKFRKLPKLYVMDIKSKTKTKIPKRMLNKYTRSMFGLDITKRGLKFTDAVIVMPHPIFKDKMLREGVLIHELVEALITQDLTREFDASSLPHHYASKAESKFYKSKHTSVKAQDKRAKKLLMNNDNWK